MIWTARASRRARSWGPAIHGASIRISLHARAPPREHGGNGGGRRREEGFVRLRSLRVPGDGPARQRRSLIVELLRLAIAPVAPLAARRSARLANLAVVERDSRSPAEDAVEKVAD